MRTLILIVGLLLAAAPLEAGQGRGAGRGQAATPAPRAGAAITVAFSTGEAALLREYYGPRFSSLPPGLQKKLERTGQLPPGWRRKMEPFPAELERRLAPLPNGYARGVFDGNAVIYVPGTSIVIDATVLF